jgi:hypothetical protein
LGSRDSPASSCSSTCCPCNSWGCQKIGWFVTYA